jgi:hypothetical protein
MSTIMSEIRKAHIMGPFFKLAQGPIRLKTVYTIPRTTVDETVVNDCSCDNVYLGELFLILYDLELFQKLDEMQVKVIVADIDDNGPTFLAHNMTLGKNLNVFFFTKSFYLKVERIFF